MEEWGVRRNQAGGKTERSGKNRKKNRKERRKPKRAAKTVPDCLGSACEKNLQREVWVFGKRRKFRLTVPCWEWVGADMRLFIAPRQRCWLGGTCVVDGPIKITWSRALRVPLWLSRRKEEKRRRVPSIMSGGEKRREEKTKPPPPLNFPPFRHRSITTMDQKTNGHVQQPPRRTGGVIAHSEVVWGWIFHDLVRWDSLFDTGHWEALLGGGGNGAVIVPCRSPTERDQKQSTFFSCQTQTNSKKIVNHRLFVVRFVKQTWENRHCWRVSGARDEGDGQGPVGRWGMHCHTDPQKRLRIYSEGLLRTSSCGRKVTEDSKRRGEKSNKFRPGYPVLVVRR